MSGYFKISNNSPSTLSSNALKPKKLIVEDCIDEKYVDIELPKPQHTRFADYYRKIKIMLASMKEMELGDEEPAIVAAIRPFLLHAELDSDAISSIAKNAKRGKNGRTKGKDKGKELGIAFSATKPPPHLNFHKQPNQIFKTSGEYVVNNAVTTSNTVPTFYAANFQLGMLNQANALISVFDQYRIALVEVWWSPIGLGTNGAVGLADHLYHSVIDYDDSSTPSTLAECLDYENVVTLPQSDGIYRRFIPHAAYALYSGTFVSYGNVASPWIDAASYTVQHYGVKFGFEVINSAAQWDMTVRLHVEFRNVR